MYGYEQARWVWEPSAMGPVLAHACHPWYHIDHNRFETLADLIFWLGHMSEKTWVTTDDLYFIALRFQEKNCLEEWP